MSGAALRVDRLSVRFLLGRKGKNGIVHAVTDVSFELRPGRVLALVGESGCGKSVLASALLGLLPANARTRGTATLHGEPETVELCGATESVLAGSVRGRRIGLVPQSAASHLTPVRTVRGQLTEALGQLRPHETDVNGLADDLAERVGLAAPLLDRYPHELSGGMAQRAAFTLALAGDPQVILADEPTTGLDRALVERTVDGLAEIAALGKAVLLITHDLTAARRVATDLAVMYAGRLVEVGPADAVFGEPWHPYTTSLFAALPENGFQPIPGHPPELTTPPQGCAFCARVPDPPGAPCTGVPDPVPVGDRMISAHPPC